MTDTKRSPAPYDLLRRLGSSAAVMGGLPELPDYNGSILKIDDEEAARIAKDLSDAQECIREQQAALKAFAAVFDKHRRRYERAGSDWFEKMPDSFPITLELMMVNGRDAEAVLTKYALEKP